MIKPLATAVIAASLALSSVGCEQAKESVESQPSKGAQSASSGYLKPGAPIRFQHNYDGKSEVGVAEIVELSFVPEADLDRVSIKVSSTTHSIAVVADDFSGPAKAGQAIAIPVTVTAQQEGEFFVNLAVSSTVGPQTSARNFALPILVGDLPQAKLSAPKTPQGEAIRVMPAEEKMH